MLSAKTAADLAIVRKRLMLPGANEGTLDLYQDMQDAASSEDRFAFLQELFMSVDEHDTSAPFKKLPWKDCPHIQHFAQTWERVADDPARKIKFLLIYKSRQMFISWLVVAMFLWECMYRSGRLCGWQSKKADDADRMLGRIFGAWERLPPRIKRMHPCERRYMELRFPAAKNDIYAIAQGPDQVRQYTWSLLASDEMAFQESAMASYVAAQPAIIGGGMFVGISSAAPGPFQMLVEDREYAA